jgi:outer membrane receptor protein involved in Fe transport
MPLLLALGPGPAQALPPPRTIVGLATDAQDRPLPGAHLRLETMDGQLMGRTTADDQGRFTFTGVAAGTYSVAGDQEGYETATAIVTVSEGEGASVALSLAPPKLLDVDVVAKHLEEARIGIEPRIGASTYSISDQAIRTQPGGDNNSLSQVLLQAPGVAQDTTSDGGIHVRTEMANLQYRINGIALPEGVSLFGQSGGLSPRLARSADLVTGALPAEFGLRTAGIVDVQTKSGAFEHGGSVGLYGGSHAWLQPSAEASGTTGRLNYFVTGDYLQNGIGLSPATPNAPIHDDTRQGHGFGYLEYVLDSTSKLSAIVGDFVGHFQIPDRRGARPDLELTVDGISAVDSTAVNETQLEQTYFGVLSYLTVEQDLSYQVAVFSRYSTLDFRPDLVPDLLFNGVAQDLHRSSIASGLQADGRYVLTPSHTLRTGVYFAAEHMSVQTTSAVLPTLNGEQTSDVPFSIHDTEGRQGYTSSVYLQDAWRVGPSLTVNGGLRFDDVEGLTSARQFSPRLNAVWTATPTTTVHAGYARYFTPPPLVFVSSASVAKFVNTTNQAAVAANAPVKPERANYFDAGVTQQIVPGLKAGLDAYYKEAVDLLDVGQFGAPVFLTPFNYQQGYNWGVELTASWVVGSFSAYGNLAAAQQTAKGIASAQTLFTPDDLAWIDRHYVYTDHTQLITASAGLAYQWHRTRIGVDLVAGSGLRRTVVHPNDRTVPPYQQLNLGVTQRFTLPAFGTFEARFDVINCLDQNYVIRDGTGIGVFAKQFGPPFGVFAGLKKEF